MKKYGLYLALLLISTQSYSASLLQQLHEKYRAFVFNRACLEGDLRQAQVLISESEKVPDSVCLLKRGLRLLKSVPNKTERQKELYDLLGSLKATLTCTDDDLEELKRCSREGYSLWMLALAFAQASLLTDQETVCFEHLVACLSVEERSQLFKQLVRQPPTDQQIRDTRVSILLNAGVVPYDVKWLASQHKENIGIQLSFLSSRMSYPSVASYCVAVERTDQEVVLKAPASRWLTLIHFARSCEGRSAHLRKYPKKVPNEKGEVVTAYRVPSLKECAFDAWAQGLTEEEVASLNELTVANRRS